MRDFSDLQNKLEARVFELNERLQHIKHDASKTHDSDWSDQAQERENNEVLYQLGLKAEQELVDLNAALNRLKTDNYGNCLECGKPIAMARLKIKPDAKLCSYCVFKL